MASLRVYEFFGKNTLEALHNAFENIEHNIDGLGHRETETLYEKPKKNI